MAKYRFDSAQVASCLTARRLTQWQFGNHALVSDETAKRVIAGKPVTGQTAIKILKAYPELQKTIVRVVKE